MLQPRNPPYPEIQKNWVQTQIKPKSQFEFVPQDTEKSKFINLVDFGDTAFQVGTVINFQRKREIDKGLQS